MYLLSAQKAAKALGVSSSTLRNWDRTGKVKSTRTPNGVRLYNVGSLLASDDGAPAALAALADGTERTKYIYARVSNRKQQGDLDRQVAYLASKYPGRTVIKDIGSGVNFNRAGFRTLVQRCVKGLVSEVVVAHRDRLARFGWELLDLVFRTSRVDVVVDDAERNPDAVGATDPTAQLADDLMAIVHVFSSRHYGQRNYGGKRKRGGGTDVVPGDDGDVSEASEGEEGTDSFPRYDRRGDGKEQGGETETEGGRRRRRRKRVKTSQTSQASSDGRGSEGVPATESRRETA